MSVDERHRLEMFERLTEVLGADVAETLLAHLPPAGERVATAAQVEALRAGMMDQIESLRADTTAQLTSLRADTTAQLTSLRADTTAQLTSLRADTTAEVTSLRDEMHHLFDLHGERMAARWRRDLLLLAVPQFLVLVGIVVSLNL